MIADIPERLQRYRAFYGAAEPALLVHIRCLERLDPSRPSPTTENCLHAVLDRVGMKPVLLTARADRIRANIDRLAQGRIVLRTDVTTEDEARELLALVRGHSRVR